MSTAASVKPLPMFARIRTRLLSRSAMYFVGFMLQRCGGLLLVPLLVGRLSAADFSRYGLLQSLLQLGPAIVTLRLHTALGRLIFDTKHFDRATLLSTSLIGGLVPMLVACCAWLGLVAWGGWRDDVTQASWPLVVSVAVILLARVITEFASILFRAIGDGPRFLATTAIDGLTMLAAGLLALLSASPSYGSLVQWLAVASCITMVACCGLFLREIPRWQVDLKTLKACLNYAWPTAVHLVGLWFCVQSSRWIGASTLGLAEMASFSLILLVVSVLSILTRTLFESERPVIGKLFAEANVVRGEEVLNRCRRRALGMSAGACAAIGVAYWFANPYLPESYRADAMMLALVSLFAIVDAYSLKSTNLLLSLKHPKSLMISSLFGGAVSLATALPLCRAFEVPGLCVALVLGAVTQASLATWFGKRALRRPMEATTIS